MSVRYQVIAKNVDAVEAVLRNEYSGVGYNLMRALVGTEATPPRLCDGDAFVLRDLFQEHGLRFGRDFYIRRVECSATS